MIYYVSPKELVELVEEIVAGETKELSKRMFILFIILI